MNLKNTLSERSETKDHTPTDRKLPFSEKIDGQRQKVDQRLAGAVGENSSRLERDTGGT